MMHPQGTRFLVIIMVMGPAFACSHGANPEAAIGNAPPLANGTNQMTPVPTFAAPQLDPNPNAPRDGSGNAIAWTAAPLLSGVTVAVSRDSALVQVPAAGISGAVDVRVFALDGNVQISGNSNEHVAGGDIYCAGDEQFNAPAPTSPTITSAVDVFNLTGPTRLVVEVIGSQCPFTGPRTSAHFDDRVTDTAELPPSAVVPFSMYTEAEIVQTYGSVITNGHGPGPQLAAPAAPTDPVVLARTTLVVTPVGYGVVPLDYWDDFNDADTPVYVGKQQVFDNRCSSAQLYQNSRWSFYSYNYDHVDYHVDRGQLQTTVADWSQDVFASSYFMPRRTVNLGSSDYLHVRYSANSDATQRRYWWIFLCGAGTAGQTLNSEGQLTQAIVQTPFFYQADGMNPSVANWNCLQVFPRDGSPFPLPPTNTRAQSDVMVMLNTPNAPVRANVVDVSPDQYGATGSPNVALASWYRQQNASGTLGNPILDDQMNIAPRTGYDLFISRTRVVMFVNGQQRLCNDFPNHALSMAEGALGFGQVLYHSAAERTEFSYSFDLRTGQVYYLNNTPYLDVRSWDYAGYQEHTPLPASFNEADCYVYP